MHATTCGALNSTGRCIMGSASFPISLLSSVFMLSQSLSSNSSMISFSFLSDDGSTLLPTRKLSDSTELILSATASAKRPIRSKTSSHNGHGDCTLPSRPFSLKASRIFAPLTSFVIPVLILPNILPRHLSHMPFSATCAAFSRSSSVIHSSMTSPHRSNPISAILSLGL